VYSLMALSLRGYPVDHPVMRAGLAGLEEFTVQAAEANWLEACQSPVWDTALAILALLDAGADPADPELRAAGDWLLDRQLIEPAGDWPVRRPDLAPGGWAFEYHNRNYPDTDDTAVVALALRRLNHPDTDRAELALRRAAEWMVGMQSKDGGWGAFDVDNARALCRDLPSGHRHSHGRGGSGHPGKRRPGRRGALSATPTARGRWQLAARGIEPADARASLLWDSRDVPARPEGSAGKLPS